MPAQRNELIPDDDVTIITRYQADYRGLVEYYLLARKVCWLHQLHRVMQTSLLRTRPRKYRTGLKAMSDKYRARTATPYGAWSCLRGGVERENGKNPLVAQWGGIPLRRQEKAVLTDLDPPAAPKRGRDRNDLIKRLRAATCERGGSNTKGAVHPIGQLADLKEKGRKEKPRWVKKMAHRRRKTLVGCATCQENIHRGEGKPPPRNPSPESGVR